MEVSSINEVQWRNKSPEELEMFAKEIFDYYRQKGFPYYNTDWREREKEFFKLKQFNYASLWDGNVIKQSMHGLGLAWSYFPHSFDVHSNGKMTPHEAFCNDEIFMNVIRKRLKMGTYISDSGIRKMLKIYTGVQGVSNFRPTAAACIYNRFATNGMVWDMSGGWGGRLLGAITAGVHTYIATEPSEKTYEGLCNLATDFAYTIHYHISKTGSENFRPFKDSLDLCFTSPPYFDLEKYADEETQSYVKFDTKEAWVEGFLRKTFENCFYGLKTGKHMIINIADIKGKHNINLEKETIRVAKEVGFKFFDEYKLALSNINLRNKEEKFKFEPIYIFTK